jgi:6-phospho-beta-glucosidase
VAERAEALAPRAWMFNFTNPAGLVAQGLHRAGFPRAVGICDSANTAQHAVAAWLNEPVDRVKTEVFGLNHLSWARSARVAGHDRLPELLADDGFVAATHLRLFGPEWVRRTGLFANEYLYYYDFRDHALRDILAAEETRGEQIARMSEALFASLAGRPGAQMMAAYNAYHRERDAGYLAHQGAQAEQDAAGGAAVGGYAGVALRTLLAVHADRPLRIALNVPNGASIAGLAADDVVEVTCTVDRRGPQPIAIGEMPPGPRALVFAVKTYERLAIEAIEARSRARAVEALVAHPLVGSVSLATALVEGYLRAHAETVGTWGP